MSVQYIYNAQIHTMNKHNEVWNNGELILRDGIIEAVGEGLTPPEAAEVLDARGGVITPGLIDAHSHVGMCAEPGNTTDINESSAPFTPLMRAVDAIHPFDPGFADARASGITTVQGGAGSTNPVAGVWSVFKTTGVRADDMIISRESGLKCALGENPKQAFGVRNKVAPYSRMMIAHFITSAFQEGKRLLDAGLCEYEQLAKQGKQAYRPFIQVLQGRMPLRVHAHRADDISAAIAIAQQFQIALSIEHCTEGALIADTLQEAGYPVTLGPFMGPSTKPETKNMNLETPRLLHERGILFAIITDHPYTPIQYLSLCAAEAVKYGLDAGAALRAITITPAMICGVQDAVGSLEPGKDADLVLWSRHPFQTRARTLRTWINGKIVYDQL
jgi:imidazolonepropionase-like amidohydrolase